MPKVKIPTLFRRYTGGSSEAEVGGSTVGEAIGNLTQEYADRGRQLYASDGKLHASVNVYKGDEDIRQLDGADNKVSEGDELSIIPSIVGGSAEPRGCCSILEQLLQTPVQSLEAASLQQSYNQLIRATVAF